jgi:hypothetical protein
MARPTTPLAPKYGKLTVLHDERKNGRRWVTCRCTCGQLVTVIDYTLKNGSVRSCGGSGCRSGSYTGVTRKPPLTTRMFAGLFTSDLTKIWAMYRSGDHSGEYLAVFFKVPVGRMYKILRAASAYGNMATLAREARARGLITKRPRRTTPC